VLEAMVPMEGLGAAMAAQRCSKEGPQIFDEFMSGALMEPPPIRVADPDWMESSGLFHRSLWDLAGNDVLKLVSGAIGFVFADRAKFDRHTPWPAKDRKRIYGEHRDIADAVRAGDAVGARELAEAHYRRINESVRKRYPALANEVIDWH
jgi:DNA-binding FadR family transcriptional regulator